MCSQMRCFVMVMLLAVGETACAGQAKTADKAQAQPTAQARPAATADDPKTCEVSTGPVDVKVTLQGRVAAARTAPIVYRAEVLKQLTIQQVVEHGATVKKGQVLLQPDRENLNKELANKRVALALDEVALKQAELELQHAKQTTPRQQEAAKIALDRAVQDLKWFLEKGKAMAVAQARESIRSAEDRMVYAREELRQLEKMYKADDLTEETEEIILRRTKDDLRRAELAQKVATLSGKKTLDQGIARREKDARLARENAEIAYQHACQAGELDMAEARLTVEQKRQAHEQAAEDLKKQIADRDHQSLTSPMNGVVYYGAFTDGLWDGAGQMTLEPKATVPAGKVVMTVFDPSSVYVKVTVPEKDLHLLRPGMRAVVRPTGFPQDWLAARVQDVGLRPDADGQFHADLKLTARPDRLVPAMTCQVELVVLHKRKAMTIPAKALRCGSRPGQWCVDVATDKGPTRRTVTVELIHEDTAVIGRGLKAGERVLVDPPSSK